jgi:soluble lytic murein transglycosylase-like protein
MRVYSNCRTRQLVPCGNVFCTVVFTVGPRAGRLSESAFATLSALACQRSVSTPEIATKASSYRHIRKFRTDAQAAAERKRGPLVAFAKGAAAHFQPTIQSRRGWDASLRSLRDFAFGSTRGMRRSGRAGEPSPPQREAGQNLPQLRSVYSWHGRLYVRDGERYRHVERTHDELCDMTASYEAHMGDR